MLPHRIGRYDVSAELGRGSTSIVYKGVDPADRRVVAIKTLQRNGTDGEADAEAILARFRHEARTIGRLRHPGVVAVDEFGEDGLHSWIAMEYVEGGNLDDLLLRSPLLGHDRVLGIMDDLLDALGCVHREGICHRDLKPANIMVTPAGRVKLTDFGVARLRDLGLTRVSSIIGTPAFMAPEQFTGDGLDHRADLFACGVLLFLLLSGRRPFSGAPAAVMHQILHEDPPLLSRAGGGFVGRTYDEVVARALAKRADDRFASAEELRDALRDAASHAAEATLATVVKTVVQEAGTLARPLSTMARGVPPELRSQAAVIEALAPHVPEAGRHITFADAPAAAPPAAPAPRLPPELCAAVQQVLARRLGPVAGVMVRRAADAAGASRPAFLASVLAGLAAPHRAALQPELEALLASPRAG
jgi:serine/threonine protein kinase